jgi:hypothetical protein
MGFSCDRPAVADPQGKTVVMTGLETARGLARIGVRELSEQLCGVTWA